MDRRGFDHNPVAISLKEKRKKKKGIEGGWKNGSVVRLASNLYSFREGERCN